MSQNNEIPAHGMIESAMDRVGSEGTALQESTSVGRRKYDAALTRRLVQIHAALGNDDPQQVPVTHASERHAEPGPSSLSDSPAVRAGGGYHFSALVFTAGIAALAGGGAMWLGMSLADCGLLPQPVAVAPVAMPAPQVAGPATPIAVAPVAAPASPVPDGEAQARDLVERWRQAWSSRDIEAYLRSYSPDFVPATGQTRGRWVAERRKKLAVPSDINVQVHHMNIERIGNDQMKVVFQQDYASGTYLEIAQTKTLLLARTGGDWLIVGEWMGTNPASSPVRK